MTLKDKVFLAVGLATLLAGCSLAPTFQKPSMTLPESFKEDSGDAKTQAWWKKAQTLEGMDRGKWWAMFCDPKLNALEDEAVANNQPLKAYAARVEQARAAVRVNAPDLLPNISVGANGSRSAPGFVSPAPYTLYTTQATASYEPDLFGRIRDADKALAFDAQATEATYRSILLSLQADVAQDYFLIRALDNERLLLQQTVDIRDKEAGIMKLRFSRGDISEEDNANAQSDMASAHADLTGLERQRAILEHALAILLGKMPSDFSLPNSPLSISPPVVTGGVPSAVLERRPDMTSAIAAMEAANERIGVAKAAYFPDLLLTASAGTETATLSRLFHWSSRAWALGQVAGLALSLPIFDNGRHSAALDSARAAYDESVINYRQQVLVAFKEVEDGLSDQRFLALQWNQAQEAASQASRATYLVQKRYDAGDVAYLDVVTSQRASLAAERAAVQLRGQRFVATVSLIRAMGGGWSSDNKSAPGLPATK